MGNLEHVTLYFDNLVHCQWDIVNDFPWDTFTPLWIYGHPSGRVMVSLSWNLCVQRKNNGSMTHRRARMPTLAGITESMLQPLASWFDFKNKQTKTKNKPTIQQNKHRKKKTKTNKGPHTSAVTLYLDWCCLWPHSFLCLMLSWLLIHTFAMSPLYPEKY